MSPTEVILRQAQDDRNAVRAEPVEARTLRETQEAFDSVAATYHASNAANPVLCDMRRRTIDALVAHVAPGSSLLDLGCGPGTDAEHLARAGYLVSAIDWSPAMVRETADRIAAAHLADRVEVHHLGIHELDRGFGPRDSGFGGTSRRPGVQEIPGGAGLQPCPRLFDAAYSNLGALNCVPDFAAAARLIASRLRPGGVLVASVIGRVCPWELACFAARRDWPRLRVRFARGLVPVPLNGRTVWTRYVTPRELERAFANAGFTRVALRSLGLFVPPPYLDAFAARHPALIARLQRLDDRLGHRAGFRAWGDHFLIVLRKS